MQRSFGRNDNSEIMKKRIVITGIGVAAPNGVGIPAFTNAIKNGVSGIRHNPLLEQLQFSCQISGEPEISDELKSQYLTELELRGFNSSGILYGVIAGIEAWTNAGLGAASFAASAAMSSTSA